jgi:hypothetical protein
MRVPTAREFFFSQAPVNDRAREERERVFFHAIALRNGTNKTTYARRLGTVNAIVNRALPTRRPLEIMDVGVSSGVSTLEWMDDLDRAGVEYRMTAGDVCVTAYLLAVTDWLHILIDNDAYPLQFEICGRAIPYPPGLRRSVLFPPLPLLMHALRWLLPLVPAAWLRQKGTRVHLIDPQLQQRGIAVVEDDLLAPCAFDHRFDVIRVANVLNRCYFSDESVVAMASTLRRRLERGGILIVCRTDDDNVNHGTVFVSTEPPHLEVLCRIGDGSEIEQLILDAAT